MVIRAAVDDNDGPIMDVESVLWYQLMLIVYVEAYVEKVGNPRGDIFQIVGMIDGEKEEYSRKIPLHFL